jgi:hypothetical protein
MPVLLSSLLLLLLAGAAIDRHALVSRHSVRVAAIDSASPLTVGNGEFGFTADVTGLQTLNATYASFPPLQTMSHWGWHKIPAALAGVHPPSYHYERVVVGAHTADYATNCTNTPEYNYLRACLLGSLWCHSQNQLTGLTCPALSVSSLLARAHGAKQPHFATILRVVERLDHLYTFSRLISECAS